MRFLIVDDDFACRELLRVFLSHYAECDMAYDGREAIDAFRLALEDKQPYDLVCLDIMMPQLNGHQTLEQIRHLEKQHGIRGADGTKVIMVTAVRDSQHCIQSFREGCESYCTKPLTEEKLIAHVRNLLGPTMEITETNT